MLLNAVQLSHLLLKDKVLPGDRVADATCGNGHDTAFLAGLVGPAGRVWAFDVQEEAVAATRLLLDGEGLSDRVEIVHAGHETIGTVVPEPLRAVIFNLGYLPGSDKSVVTRPGTTIAALEGASRLLLPGGVLMVVCYPGHLGGDEEARAVDEWGKALPAGQWQVWRCCSLNRSQAAPYLVVAGKRED